MSLLEVKMEWQPVWQRQGLSSVPRPIRRHPPTIVGAPPDLDALFQLSLQHPPLPNARCKLFAICSSILPNTAFVGSWLAFLKISEVPFYTEFLGDRVIRRGLVREWSRKTHRQAGDEGRIGQREMTDNVVVKGSLDHPETKRIRGLGLIWLFRVVTDWDKCVQGCAEGLGIPASASRWTHLSREEAVLEQSQSLRSKALRRKKMQM